jgi:hypothetical protein
MNKEEVVKKLTELKEDISDIRAFLIFSVILLFIPLTIIGVIWLGFWAISFLSVQTILTIIFLRVLLI